MNYKLLKFQSRLKKVKKILASVLKNLYEILNSGGGLYIYTLDRVNLHKITKKYLTFFRHQNILTMS